MADLGSETDTHRALIRCCDVVRDALTTMQMMDNNFYEEEAGNGLDALDEIEAVLGLGLLRNT